ncbi:hypothetical protein EN827_18485 [Mesorhizobium sp. M1D.F.Ca.ET.184.01.1.1]|nr:hypothetical protein EN874_018485 [Mesorhizobium sp. M1D.F.Ca.ET.231.01.1.1]TGP31180.1 hypothetical protein EN877_18490 [Mesorhizobium sp. M1D.F.Ca.ET.234.01.1.1]TGS45482.1 hypothetical protein EN827_18485 [Mesorhizobium sp. M1D.F.Ca.ET.184.01.1.1]TGS60957.1 hypothetical protein EN826_018485 [Mesorhizobium sp. M1D.F.Ca.ET.183.01.1.1]
MRGGADFDVWPSQNLILYRRCAVHLASKVGAAPHPAAATFSPYSDGEKETTPAASTPPTARRRSAPGRSASRPGCST